MPPNSTSRCSKNNNNKSNNGASPSVAMASVDALDNHKIKLLAFSNVELEPPALTTLASNLATHVASML
jgi:hypothetical protein